MKDFTTLMVRQEISRKLAEIAAIYRTSKAAVITQLVNQEHQRLAETRAKITEEGRQALKDS